MDFTAEEVASVVAEAKIELSSRSKKPSTAAFIGKNREDNHVLNQAAYVVMGVNIEGNGLISPV